jgi:hypothetical protein
MREAMMPRGLLTLYVDGHLPRKDVDVAQPVPTMSHDDFENMLCIIDRLNRKMSAESAEKREAQMLRPELEFILNQALDDEILERSWISDETEKNYKADIRRFREWCMVERWSDLPALPEVVAFFLIFLASDGATMDVLRRHVAAISWAHRMKELYDPTGDIAVKAAIRWIEEKRAEESGNAKRKH